MVGINNLVIFFYKIDYFGFIRILKIKLQSPQSIVFRKIG